MSKVSERAIRDGLNRAAKERKKRKEEILGLKGKEEAEYDIGMLEGRINNCRADLKIFPKNLIVHNKLKNMEEQLKRRQEDLQKMTEQIKKLSQMAENVKHEEDVDKINEIIEFINEKFKK